MLGQNQLETSILFPVLFQGGNSPFGSKSVSGLQLWLRADKGTFQDSAKTTVASSDADVIGAWADQSGNGNDALQVTTANKPVLKLSIINNKSVVRSDGINDKLVIPNIAGLKANGGITVFVVFISSESSANTGPIGMWSAGDPGWALLGNAVGVTTRGGFLIRQATPSASKSADTAADMTDGSVHLLVGIYDLSNVLIASDSILVVGDAIADNEDSSEDISIGKYSDIAAGTFFASDIAEILIYDSALSNTDRQTVENYLNARYAIF